MCVFLSYSLLFPEKRNKTGWGRSNNTEVERSERSIKQVNCSRNIICAPSIIEQTLQLICNLRNLNLKYVNFESNRPKLAKKWSV